MEKKKLLQSQTELLSIRRRELDAFKDVVQNTLDTICKELGVSENELDQWRLSEDMKYLEKIKQKTSSKP
ncbi:unnamed protein product [marine sediment metagenome]|uniref:Uncharacterized protein n=1 Tax=marine sediment metagenome TaxID=412755 RepID=X1HSE9_9ZZZZ